ncbi:MAG: ComEC/Rec2 family competence protein, partial [Candidatus Gastranaerophilales bacterium]|nr:ComEC/Rec2 family competence protein [Candidatus Gastranaerophilales bacterium]
IPIQIYYFQTVSLYAILANMLVVPFMAIISFCGFISSILAAIPKIGTYICLVLDKINEPFLTYLYFIADKFSEIPNNIAQVGKLNYIEITLYYLLLFLFIYMLKNKFKNIKINIATGLVFIALILNFSVKGFCGEDLTLTFLNVGEGDSIFIQTPNNKKILVDAGRLQGKTRTSGASVVVPYLKYNGITDIDIMLLTHPDTDHIGGSVDVLNNIKVNKIITNGESAKNKTYLKLQNYIKKNNIEEVKITKLQEISPDENLSIVAFTPPDTNKKSQNDTSIILLIKYKDFDAILMGDNETNSYKLLKENLHPTGEIEVFKVGHHGSKNAVDEKMAELISPEVSVFSVGENSYGHPSEKALDLLKKSRIYRTDINNTIKIKTNGKTFDIYTFNPTKNCWKKSEK